MPVTLGGKSVNMSLMFKFSWVNLFFERGEREVFKAARNKLFAGNEKQCLACLACFNHKLSVVCTYHCRGVYHHFLVWLLFVVDLCSQKGY